MPRYYAPMSLQLRELVTALVGAQHGELVPMNQQALPRAL
jgi:hypothetical protein